VDKGTSPCPSSSQDMSKMGDKWDEWMKRLHREGFVRRA
jgi:hypothetical protein